MVVPELQRSILCLKQTEMYSVFLVYPTCLQTLRALACVCARACVLVYTYMQKLIPGLSPLCVSPPDPTESGHTPSYTTMIRSELIIHAEVCCTLNVSEDA